MGLGISSARAAVPDSPRGDEGDDYVGGVLVEVLAAAVVDGGRAGISVAGGYLDVAQGDAGVEGGHDERRAQHVGVDGPEPRPAADGTHPAARGASVEALPVLATEDRAGKTLDDGEVDGPSGAGDEGDDGGYGATGTASSATPRVAFWSA